MPLVTHKQKARFNINIPVCYGLFILALSTIANGAEVYKYIDRNGKIQYSDRPFTYLQKNYTQGDDSAALKANDSSIKTDLLLGLWDLTGYSKHLGNDRMDDEGKWQFKDDGSLTIKIGDTITTTQYRIQGKLIEIIESNSWAPYRVASLSKDNLTLKNENGGKILYFSRNTIIKEVVKVNKALYRRDQIKDLVLFFTCNDIKFESLSKEEKETIRTDIFRATGIEHFDENVFLVSVDHYKKDQIFIEQYQPMINKEFKECSKTNVVPRFDVQ